MPRPEPRRIALLSAAAYSGMFVFGIVMALLGAILPAMAGRLEFQVADIGTLFLVMNGAMLAASLVLGLAMDRFGIKPPLAIGAFLVAAALVIVARATALSDLLAAVVLLGIGGGALNGGTNTLVADLHEDPQQKNAALNLLGVFFGFGALLLPFAIGALLARFSLAALLLAAAIPCGLVGLFASTLRFPPPKQGHRLPVADMPRFLRDPLVVVLACLLFFQSGVEFTLGGFIATYLTREMGASVSQASWVLTAFWAAIMGTRIGTQPGCFTHESTSCVVVVRFWRARGRDRRRRCNRPRPGVRGNRCHGHFAGRCLSGRAGDCRRAIRDSLWNSVRDPLHGRAGGWYDPAVDRRTNRRNRRVAVGLSARRVLVRGDSRVEPRGRALRPEAR